MELRPRRRRRLGGCLLVALGLVAAAVVAALLSGPQLLPALPVLSGATASGAGIQQQYIGGDPQAESSVAVVDVKGLIVSAERFDAASVPRVVGALKTAAASPDIVAVILDMNTPGGEVTASDEIHHAVQHLRKLGKPVVTCMRSLAASGGYYIAAGTDYIIANRLTLTGSVGVLMSSFNYADLLDKVGVRARIYKSGRMKDLLNGAVERTPEEKERREQLLQNLVDQTFMEFAEVVADGRGFASAESVRDASFGDGRVLSGEQALTANLVDRLGYFPDAVDKAMEAAGVSRARVVRLQPKVSVVDRLMAMQGIASQWLPEAVAPSELRLLQPGRLYYLAAFPAATTHQ